MRSEDMFGIEIKVGDYIAYIGASEYATKRKGFVSEVKDWDIKLDNKGNWLRCYNCVSLETETST